jgi:hypothetical protein
MDSRCAQEWRNLFQLLATLLIKTFFLDVGGGVGFEDFLVVASQSSCGIFEVNVSHRKTFVNLKHSY